MIFHAYIVEKILHNLPTTRHISQFNKHKEEVLNASYRLHKRKANNKDTWEDESQGDRAKDIPYPSPI